MKIFIWTHSLVISSWERQHGRLLRVGPETSTSSGWPGTAWSPGSQQPPPQISRFAGTLPDTSATTSSSSSAAALTSRSPPSQPSSPYRAGASSSPTSAAWCPAAPAGPRWTALSSTLPAAGTATARHGPPHQPAASREPPAGSPAPSSSQPTVSEPPADPTRFIQSWRWPPWKQPLCFWSLLWNLPAGQGWAEES